MNYFSRDTVEVLTQVFAKLSLAEKQTCLCTSWAFQMCIDDDEYECIRSTKSTLRKSVELLNAKHFCKHFSSAKEGVLVDCFYTYFRNEAVMNFLSEFVYPRAYMCKVCARALADCDFDIVNTIHSKKYLLAKDWDVLYFDVCEAGNRAAKRHLEQTLYVA